MPATKLKKPTKVGRYTYDAVAREVARAIGRGGRGTRTQLAKRLGMDPSGVSHRIAGTYAQFDLVELGICADFFAETQGPEGYRRGWPLMTFEESQDQGG